MTDNPHDKPALPPLTSEVSNIKPEDAIKRREYKKDTFIRSTYSPSNAEQFKPVFEEMIRTRQNRTIYCATTGYKASSLYIKAHDALKWLCDVDDNRATFALLRSQIMIRRLSDGVGLYFRPTVANMIANATVTHSLDWKADLLKFLETAKEGDMFVRDGIMITEEVKTWANGVLLGITGIEYIITNNSIKVMR